MADALVYRRADDGQPGVHVLIAGVSDYPRLPEGEPSRDPLTLGMARLSSAARGAHKVCLRLRELDAAGHLPLPIASVRLLLSPSPREVAADPALADHHFRADLGTFRDSARAWRQDASQRDEDATFFYFAGHGIQRTRRDQVLLLEGFGDPGGTLLEHAFDTNSLYFGMAPSANAPQIARTQIYFVDACRNHPPDLRLFEEARTTPLFNVFLSGKDDRRAPVFYASVPDAFAYGLPGQHSLFSEALLGALDSTGVRRPETPGGPWTVTYSSLARGLEHEIDRLNRQYGTDMLCTADGFAKDAVLVTRADPPAVRVELRLDPGTAAVDTELDIKDATGQAVWTAAAPIDPHPCEPPVEAGYYVVLARRAGAERMLVFEASPPRAEWRIPV